LSFFAWLEGTAISEWVRESPSLFGFPFILYLHTLGLALIAGLSSAVAIWILASKGQLTRLPLVNFFPLMWIGLAINVVSGIALLAAYPAKAMTNPVFYIKLIAIAFAVGIVQWLQRQFTFAPIAAPAGGSAPTDAAVLSLKRAAWSLLLLWAIATVTGRLLAYTHSILLASMGF
jgi:hypothetical protein